MKVKGWAGLYLGLAVAGCAEQSAMRLANDTVQLHVSTAPIYGSLEPQRRVMTMAAQETLKAGFDKFLIGGGQNTFKPNVLGYTAATAQSSAVVGPDGGGAQSSYVGPQPVAMPRFESDVVVKMFKASDPAGVNAVDARQIVGKRG